MAHHLLRMPLHAEHEARGVVDLRAFHGTVLGNGAVPLGVLEQIVMRWIERDAA